MELSLLIKKLKNQLTEKEKLEFEQWYNESRDHRLFFEKARNNFGKEKAGIDSGKAWIRLVSLLNKRNKRRFTWHYAIAALLVLALSTTFYFNYQRNSTLPNPSAPLENAIVLTTEDGIDVNLTTSKNYRGKNVTGSDKQLHYFTDSVVPHKIVFNYLTIPRGELFTITLSDNTKIWLNSDTKIKFPVHFKSGEPRMVEVLYGEAYFEVSPTPQNSGMNFLVQTGTQVIEVLGTEFNVKAYKEDHEITTTLSEGSVELSNQLNKDKNILKPGLQSIYDPSNISWMVKEVNVENETSWREGVFTFKDKALIEIMITLSRWYDVDVEFSNKSLENIQFNGVIRKTQKLEDILKILQETGKVEYRIENQKITIKQNSK